MTNTDLAGSEKMSINSYLQKIKGEYATGKATEHSYRGYLQTLIQDLAKDVQVTNEPKRQKCGAPDYIVQKKDVPIGYIEAKDIGVDLDSIEKTDQLKRYLPSLDNLILTDYLEFRFFKYAEKRPARPNNTRLMPMEPMPIAPFKSPPTMPASSASLQSE